LFKVKSPHSEAFRKILPEAIEKAPLLTTVVRQYGEAWKKPFVAVYEPSTSKAPATITSVKPFLVDNQSTSFVGLQIDSKGDRKDFVFSSDVQDTFNHNDINFTGTYGVLTQETNSTTFFIGAGREISYNGYTIEILGKKSSAATLVIGKQFKLTCNDPVLLTVPDIYKKGDVVLNMGFKQLQGSRTQKNGNKVVAFKVLPTDLSDISIKLKTN
ncbi:hypothetical protein N9W61_03055, partial [Algibacter sp.]|nr:hypothetical protein [Algibacter sp.]